MTSSVEKTPRGRPRDPDLEDKVFDAVMHLYADGGWSAMTFEAVSRQAGIGKSPLYRRWQGRPDLLRATLEARWLQVHTIDTGTLRGDMSALAQMIFANRTGAYSRLESWFVADAARYPEIREVVSPYKEQVVLEARAIVRRAKKRGEVPQDLNAGLLIDLVVGGVNNHVITTPGHLKASMIRKSPQFLEELINVVLRGFNVADKNS